MLNTAYLAIEVGDMYKFIICELFFSIYCNIVHFQLRSCI